MSAAATAVLVTCGAAALLAPWGRPPSRGILVPACGAQGPAEVSARPGGARAGVRWPWVERAGPADDDPDAGVVLELLALAVRTAALPDALRAVGDAVGGPTGRGLALAGAALRLGAPWDEAWRGCGGGAVPAQGRRRPDGGQAPTLALVETCLRAAWEQGAAPAPALRAARDRHEREADVRAADAAEVLGVRVVVPLGLCLLPAFVLLGLVPAVIALVGGLV
ncbi:type II secretion system F family protein [Sanguibacter sp. A247]|uniref:type II secretion system F family protein n=1 Tax=unclassified Sanguibacter TaxID=2645534 RepID=UPI003FD8D13C